MLKGAHPMGVLTMCVFLWGSQVLSTAVVTEKCLQQARQEQPATSAITADNQNHYKSPCLTRCTAQHCDFWIKSLKISDRWQRYMVYLHAAFPNIALLVLTSAVVEVFKCNACFELLPLPRRAALPNASFLTLVISLQTGNWSFSQTKCLL